jgi:maleate cis-trans isomerase
MLRLAAACGGFALALGLAGVVGCSRAVMAHADESPLIGALAKLEKFPIPQRRVGFVSPLPISDTVPYMFYGAFRDRVMLVQESLHLRGYDVASARAALHDLDHALTGMTTHGVELIVIGGSVLSFAYDRATLLERLREASHKLGVPVTTDMEATVQMMRHAGVHKVAVAHRLNGLDDKALTDYLTAAGFAVEGIVGPQLVIATRAGSPTDENLAFALTGEAAGQLHPRADGILFLGGSTINYPYLSVIQRTTGKPVFNNTMAFLDYVDSWLTSNPRKRVP